MTVIFRAIAERIGIVDRPDGERKKHTRPVALLGGVAIFLSFWIAIGYVVWYHPVFGIEKIENSLGALFFGGLLLVLVGIADEIRPYSASVRSLLLFVTLAIVSIFLPIEKVTNPMGGSFFLGPLVGSLVVFGWLTMTTVSVKLLDGVDGLAGSIVLVGAFIVAALTLSRTFYQPNVALVALVFCAVLLGFLCFNWPRASIFLGESGSLLIGYMVGGLAILAGSKIATAILVLAVPMLDVARVVYLRIIKKVPWSKGDRTHLHFVLVDAGWSAWAVVAFLALVAAIFGIAGLFLESYQKIVALCLLTTVFALFVFRTRYGRAR